MPRVQGTCYNMLERSEPYSAEGGRMCMKVGWSWTVLPFENAKDGTILLLCVSCSSTLSPHPRSWKGGLLYLTLSLYTCLLVHTQDRSPGLPARTCMHDKQKHVHVLGETCKVGAASEGSSATPARRGGPR